MKQVTINGWVHWRKPYEWEPNESGYTFFAFDDASSSGYVMVMPLSISFDLPEGFDPKAAQISALEKEKERITNEFYASVTRIETEISKLKAIEYSPSADTADIDF